jgi:hypothetical protein
MAAAGKLGPSHLFMEDYDRFSRMGSRDIFLLSDFKNAGVTLHFIWDRLVIGTEDARFAGVAA